jgi:hypothetical protein
MSLPAVGERIALVRIHFGAVCIPWLGGSLGGQIGDCLSDAVETSVRNGPAADAQPFDSEILHVGEEQRRGSDKVGEK